jgi:type IV pilus assembly protein PilM
VAQFSNKLRSGSQPGGRPQAAVELAPEGVLAAAVGAPGQQPLYAFASVPAGALVPGIAESNLRNSGPVTEALRTALEEVSPRNRHVTVVIPDTAARVFVLDFDTLPAKSLEAIPVIRFRLRKMVPFDVEHAAVSYQVLAQRDEGEKAGSIVKVLATVMPGPILAEYEAAVRAAGYEPGAVLPSSLAALAALDSPHPVLAANLSGLALTTAITSGDDLLLYRTVELPEDPAARVAEVQRSVAVAAAYFEDKLNAPPREVHYAGAVDAREFSRAISESHLTVLEVAPTPSSGATTALGPIGFAGVMGALAHAQS